jgi:hypothetical protein
VKGEERSFRHFQPEKKNLLWKRTTHYHVILQRK